MGDSSDQKKEVGSKMPPEEAPPTPEEIVTREIVEDIVRNYSSDVELDSFSAVLGTKAGDNYMSIMYAVTIHVKSKTNRHETETIQVMLKTMPRNVLRQQMINDAQAFVKEMKMYEEIFSAFKDFQLSKGIKSEDLYEAYPRCYSTFHDGKMDFLALQDLRSVGYKVVNRQVGLDMDHCRLVLRKLAQFHALSFAMFHGDFEKILEKYAYMQERFILHPDEMSEANKVFFPSSIKSEAELLRSNSFLEEAKLAEALYTEDFFMKMHNLVGIKCPFAVINHGDLWTNNMLFKYDYNGKPVDVKFIDFQLTRCSSRTLDLNYFFHTSVQMHLLNDSEGELLGCYHDEFVKFARTYGIDPQQHGLELKDFVKEYDDHRFYGVVMGCLLTPFVNANSADVPDMEGITEEVLSEEHAHEFLGDVMKSKLVLTKVHNLMKHHVIKLHRS